MYQHLCESAFTQSQGMVQQGEHVPYLITQIPLLQNEDMYMFMQLTLLHESLFPKAIEQRFSC